MLYRVHYSAQIGVSQGFEWFGSYREARRAAYRYWQEEISPFYDYESKAEALEEKRRVYDDIIAQPIPTTKQDLLAFLNLFAEHPSNGEPGGMEE